MTQADAGEVVAAHRGRLRRFIRRRVANDTDADDLLQDVLASLVEAEAWTRPIEQVTAWLYRTARNAIIDRSRKKHEEPLPLFGEEGELSPGDDEIAEVLFGTKSDPEDEYMRRLFWERLEQALAVLPEPQRVAFERTELQGWSFKRLSEETGVGVNTLLARKRYAVLTLREALRELYDEIVEGGAN